MSAPVTKVEVVMVVRPPKVFAFLCNTFGLFLGVIACASTAWMEAGNYRQGLWEECFYQDVKKQMLDCSSNPSQDWLVWCEVLCTLALICGFLACISSGYGLKTDKYDRKFKLYKAAMYLSLSAVILMLLTLVIFPAKFMNEINQRRESKWRFTWAYALEGLFACLQFGATILLLVDREAEEIYYREKTVYPEGEDEGLTQNEEKQEPEGQNSLMV